MHSKEKQEAIFEELMKELTEVKKDKYRTYALMFIHGRFSMAFQLGAITGVQYMQLDKVYKNKFSNKKPKQD